MEYFIIFKCSKCEHEVHIKEVKNVINLDCPVCGEEPDENWILTGLEILP